MNPTRQRLAKLETLTYQAAMLQTAQRFGGHDTRFYASMLCAQADLKALKTGCDELQRLAKEYSEPAPVPESEPESEPTWANGLSGAAILSVIMWEVFQTAPRAWRLPGGETALIEGLRPWDERLREMDNKAVKAFLNSELERVARIKEDELENPPTET
jgi:hypothetical protein